LSIEETALMHSANERLSFVNAGRMVAFLPGAYPYGKQPSLLNLK